MLEAAEEEPILGTNAEWDPGAAVKEEARPVQRAETDPGADSAPPPKGRVDPLLGLSPAGPHVKLPPPPAHGALADRAVRSAPSLDGDAAASPSTDDAGLEINAASLANGHGSPPLVTAVGEALIVSDASTDKASLNGEYRYDHRASKDSWIFTKVGGGARIVSNEARTKWFMLLGKGFEYENVATKKETAPTTGWKICKGGAQTPIPSQFARKLNDVFYTMYGSRVARPHAPLSKHPFA